MYADANNCLNTWEELYHKDIVELRSVEVHSLEPSAGKGVGASMDCIMYQVDVWVELI